jgi:glycosyltransferase involved in cell wall biosynthesis
MIKFSVVVCAYNEEKYLEQCLESLYKQNYDKQNYEVIVIDNESKDKTPDICQSFYKKYKDNVKIKYFRIKHVGLSTSRNFGVENADGKIVVFVDGDAITDANLLNEYEKTFNETNCDFSGGRINLLNTESEFAKLLQETRYKQIFSGFNVKNKLHGANMAFKKEIFDKFLFIENFYSRGDDTSFIQLISDTFVYSPSKNSIVFHERPTSFKEWFNILTTELKLSFKVEKLITAIKGKSKKYFFKSWLINTTLLLILLALPFVPIVSIVFIAIVIKYKRSYFHIYKKISHFIFSFIMMLLEIVLTPIYYLISYSIYRNEQPLSHKTKVEILLCKNN